MEYRQSAQKNGAGAAQYMNLQLHPPKVYVRVLYGKSG